MDSWKLRDARARFSEVVDRAREIGPQLVTRRGENAVVVLSYADCRQTLPKRDFKPFLLSSRSVSDLFLRRAQRLPKDRSRF